MSRLSTLEKHLEEARADRDAYLDILDSALVGDAEADIEPRAWTPEEEAELKKKTEHVTLVEARVKEATAEQRTATEQEEVRQRTLGHDRQGSGTAEDTQVTFDEGIVRVGNEPLTYSEANPQHQFFRDMLYASTPASPQHTPAKDRLMRHQDEIRAIARYNTQSKEGRAAQKVMRDLQRGEKRDISTQTGSMGDFAPPLYFLPDYAPYRVYGRTFIDALRHMPLPDTGLTFNIPQITQPTIAANQTTATQGAGDNTTVTTRDMTADYQSGTLQTIIDNSLVSQQYLDRVGPGIGGDQIVRDDQQRQLNLTLNQYAWGALMNTSGIGIQTYSDSAFNAYKFIQTVGKAKAAISTTAGTVAYPTHFITDVDLWETIETAYDGNDRPYVVPQGVAFNPLAVGDSSAVPEGYTGFRFAALPAYKDQSAYVAWDTNAGAASAGYAASAAFHVSLVGALDIAAVWLEGTPVYRVLPQPYVTTLTVVIQQFVYCAFIPIYPAAFQLVFGTGTQPGYLTA